MNAYEFGRSVALKVAHAQKRANDFDNELSPDALAGAAVAKKMLAADPLPAPTPLRRVPPTLVQADTKVRDIPAVAMTASRKPEKTPEDYRKEYDAWRLGQGLTPGGPKGTDAPLPLNQLGGSAPVQRPPLAR